jgi:TatD DNase family protein
MQEAIDAVAHVVAENPSWRRTEHERINGMNALRGVFHCFTGTVEEANRLFELGFLVSYPGIVTFKNSPALDVLRAIGFERILIETDSPYLSPVPLRGKRNEPANVVLVANKVAEVFGVAPHEVGRITSANSRALFGLNGA